MAQPYLNQLEKLLKNSNKNKIICKHFFNDAACWTSGKMFASLTPTGFALKLPEETRSELFKKGGSSLRYFPKAPIKKEYVVLTNKIMKNTKVFKKLIKTSVNYTEAKLP